jgi:hypothetical protein
MVALTARTCDLAGDGEASNDTTINPIQIEKRLRKVATLDESMVRFLRIQP